MLSARSTVGSTGSTRAVGAADGSVGSTGAADGSVGSTGAEGDMDLDGTMIGSTGGAAATSSSVPQAS